MKLTSPQLTSWLLRIGLAIVFVYAAVSSLMHPNEWIGFLPSFIATSPLASTFLVLFSVGELVLSIWLLSGKYVQYPAILATLAFVGILIAQPDAFSTTFRDVGLAFMALALVALESPQLARLFPSK
ncbi:MAG: hypothetical protein JWO99_769 [Candidatus Saccharibacteria bacterium]|nr:hypothetical protein [Candidatus Saccharibacteria bacterium]